MATTWNLRSWRDRWPAAPTAVESVLALALSALAVAIACGVWKVTDDGRQHGAAEYVALVTMTLPAAWARRAPLAAVSVTAAATLANGLIFGQAVRCGVALPAMLIIAFGIGLRLGWPRVAAGLALCAADLVAEAPWDPQIGWPGLATIVPLVLAFVGLGSLVRARNASARALRVKSAQLRVQREETARLAVAADRTAVTAAIDDTLRERLRGIAEVAAAGLDPATDDPDAARLALAAVEHDGRAALGQLRDVVGGLRPPAPDPAAPVRPQPSLARLPELLRGLPAARARLTVEGAPRPLAAGLELSGYRIVEHLVTALADEPGAVIEVRLRYAEQSLELRVRGTAPTADLQPVVAAARQRAALHGGSMESRLDGGFCLTTAMLPLVSGYA